MAGTLEQCKEARKPEEAFVSLGMEPLYSGNKAAGS